MFEIERKRKIERERERKSERDGKFVGTGRRKTAKESKKVTELKPTNQNGTIRTILWKKTHNNIVKKEIRYL